MSLPRFVKQRKLLEHVSGSHPPLQTRRAHLLPISAMASGILVQCTLALSVGLEPGRCAVAALIDIS